ncbi:MAG: hypothetical protein ACI828_001384 [Flavobacteriales bacterium]
MSDISLGDFPMKKSICIAVILCYFLSLQAQELGSKGSNPLEIAFAKALLTQPFPISSVLYDQTSNRTHKMTATDVRTDDVYSIHINGTHTDALKFIKTH